MAWPKGPRNRVLGRPPWGRPLKVPEEAVEPQPPPQRVPFAQGDPFFRAGDSKRRYVGTCPGCASRGVLCWRVRTEDYRCQYCEIEVGDDILAGRIEPVRDAFRDGLEALRSARLLEFAGDATGAVPHRQKAQEQFRRLAAILPRWKIGPVAGIRRGPERGG